MSGPLFPLYQEVPEIVLIFICQINSLILNLKITYWMTCLHCHCTCDTYKLHNAKLHVLVTVNTKFIQCMLKHAKTISEKFNELDSFLKTMYLYLLHFKNPKQTNYHPWGLVQNLKKNKTNCSIISHGEGCLAFNDKNNNKLESYFAQRYSYLMRYLNI